MEGLWQNCFIHTSGWMCTTHGLKQMYWVWVACSITIKEGGGLYNLWGSNERVKCHQ